MSPQPFVHLHLHSQYSLLDGAIKLDPLFERAKSLQMPAVGMTDHGNLFGVVEFYGKARKSGVKPIIGCETYIASGSRFDKEVRERDSSGFDAINHLLLLAMNETGYHNLIQLVSRGYLEGFYYKPRIDMDLLRKHSAGLIATSGCLSSLVSRAILNGQPETAWRQVEEFAGIFDDGRFYLELQRHGIDEQDRVNSELLKMATDLRLPLLATNDAHYLEASDHAHHDALLCIGTASNLDDPKRFRFDGHGFYVKSGDEMLEVFHDHPSAVRNSLEIAERCNVDIELDSGRYHLPEFQVPEGQSKEAVLRAQSIAGLRQRLGLSPDEPLTAKHEAYRERLDYELSVIERMGFPGYFLIVADFIGHARKNGIPVGPGRGSSAGSLVAYSLGITGIDPIEYDILFERFLNPERISMPDIDVDFCVKGRDQVIRYVGEKYDGEGVEGKRVAQIITFGKLQARAVLRDVGRVMGMNYADVDRIAKLVPEVLNISLDEALEQSAVLRSRVETDGQVARLVETARRLEGLTRHASTHAAGVVIAPTPLIETVPLYRDPRSGAIVTQLDMKSVEKVGLIKFDFLGLKNLTTIADAEQRIRASGFPDFSIEKIPLDDRPSYELLASGDTEGIFQVESDGMTDLVIKLRPRSFKELIPIVALYRPGPLNSGMVEEFVNRKNGFSKVDYLLPEMEQITAETLGVIVYQDQVLQIANRLAGYSLGEADLLRRAMGKKQTDEMAKQRERFVSGAVERGTDRRKAEQVFDLVAEFAEYGFAKSHSAAYALITYQTAYLKANHPREYLAALMTTEAGNHDKLGLYIAHSAQMGIPVLAPDVNESSRDFTVVESGIRFGFAGVKNVGEGAIESILEARASGGPFRSLFDFASRIDGRRVNRRVVESLLKCGAFDSLDPRRSALWAGLDAALEAGACAQRDREIGQASLFGTLGGGGGASEPPLPDAPDWTDRQRLEAEKEVLGFYVSGHPLAALAKRLERFVDTTASQLAGKQGREARVGGLLTGLREHRTRRGALMARCTLEDLEGSIEALFFAEEFARFGDLLRRALGEAGQGPLPLLMSGKFDNEDPPKLLVSEVLELERADERLAAAVEIRLSADEASPDRLVALRGVLERFPGECPVQLRLVVPGESETVLDLPELSVHPGPVLLEAIGDIFGRNPAELRF